MPDDSVHRTREDGEGETAGAQHRPPPGLAQGWASIIWGNALSLLLKLIRLQASLRK